MKRYLTLGYGAAAYLLFLAAFLYLIGFVGNLAVPRSVDHALTAPVTAAIPINAALVALFGLQHSVMARPAFKRWWVRLVPTSIERSTYVLLSSVVLALLYWQWRTMPTVLWDVRMPAARAALWALFWLGWAIALLATFLINHFDLFGLRQVYLASRQKPYTSVEFRVRLLYRVVRHPLMLGMLIAFWAAPTMTAGHLLFSIGMTTYVLIATQLEERDLVASIGHPYREYRREVSMLLPIPRRQATGVARQG